MSENEVTREESHANGDVGDGQSTPSVLEIASAAEPQLVSPHGGQISIPIELKNPSNHADLQLTLKGKSCDCAGYRIVPETIPPGETGLLTVHASVGNQTEFRRLSLAFRTGLEDPKEIHVTTQLRSLPQIEFSPNRMPVLSVPFGKSEEFNFDVFCHERLEDDVVSAAISSDSDELQVALLGKEEITQFGVRRTIYHCKAIVTVPPRDNTNVDGVGRSALIGVQHGPVSGEVRMVWQPQNLIDVQPPRILVNARGVTDGLSKTVSLDAKAAFRILSIETRDPDLIAQGNSDSKQMSHNITLTFAGQSQADAPKKWTLTVRTDHPDEPEVQIPVFLF